MIVSGAITFFFDFDIFSEGPIENRFVRALAEGPAVALFDLGRLEPLAVRPFPVAIGFVTDHALREQAGEGFVDDQHGRDSAGRG